MKFQKDNSQNRLTPEIVAARKQEAATQRLREDAELEILRQQAKDSSLIHARRTAYPNLEDQLDMLWHDISDGKIQADTTSQGTWYQKLKGVKENNPLPK